MPKSLCIVCAKTTKRNVRICSPECARIALDKSIEKRKKLGLYKTRNK